MKKQTLEMQFVTEIENNKLRNISGGMIATLGAQIATWVVIKYYETKNAIETIQNARPV